MKLHVKNMPKLALADLLKRRKMSLKQYMDEFGITTFEGLATRCQRMGVTPPDESVFLKTNPVVPIVNNPSEGIVIVEPFPITASLGEAESSLPNDSFTWDALQPLDSPQQTLSGSQKRSKKKKDGNNQHEQ